MSMHNDFLRHLRQADQVRAILRQSTIISSGIPIGPKALACTGREARKGLNRGIHSQQTRRRQNMKVWTSGTLS